MKRLLLVLVLICLISLTFVGCGDDAPILPEVPEDSEESLDIPAIEDETEDETENENNIEPEETYSYEYHITIATIHVKAIATELAKGDTFRAKLEIWKAAGDKLIEPMQPESIVFYILDPGYKRILDAGLIKGTYEFSFVVERSGDYWFYLSDRDITDCIIYMYCNSEAPFYDISVR